MKCISCKAEINPKWTHAIDANICPFCGASILDEHLKNLLSILRDTMDKIKDYPDQLNDWMLSNYNFIRTDSPQIEIYAPKSYNKISNIDDTKKLVKIATEFGEQEIIVEKIKSEEETSEFLKRAEVVKPGIDGFKSLNEKSAHLKEMIKQIKNGNNQMIDESLEVNNDNQQNALTYSSMLSNDDFSVLPPSSGNFDDDDIPSVVQSMAAHARPNGGANNADLQKLQDMVNKSKRPFRGK